MSNMYFENLPNTTTPLNKINLDKLNDVKVSTEQPITGEQVWIKKGKNLINPKKNIYNINYNEFTEKFESTENWILTDYIPINPNTNYVFSHYLASNNGSIDYFDKDKNYLGNVNSETLLSSFKITNANAKYIIVKVYSLNINNESWMQLEPGVSASSFEPYIKKEILIKNDDGAYETFYSESSITKSIIILSSKITDVDYNDVVRSGNIVTVYARFYVNQQVDNAETWAVLPYLPANDFAIDLKKGRYEFTGDKFEYTSHTDGELKGNPLEPGWYQCNFTYITNA